MNPFLLLLGFLLPLAGLAGGGSGGKGKVAVAKVPVQPIPDQTDPDDDSTDTPTDTGGTGGGTGGTGTGGTGGGGGGTVGGGTDPVIVEPPSTTPKPPAQNDVDDDNGTATTNIFETGSGVLGGRVTTLAHDDGGDIASIRITGRPEHGNVTVNPDNTIALVMTDSSYTGSVSFEYEVTYADGTTQAFKAPLTVQPGPQAAGWSMGNNIYMLETDENDDIVVETGENHRMVYVSGSEDALTLADIAALEGVDVSKITASWLKSNPEYGSSEGMALAGDAGKLLWNEITDEDNEPSSNWLLFERGYEYDFIGTARGMQGESELHPIHITAYGVGERPILNSELKLFFDEKNVVFSDVVLTDGARVLNGGNYIFDDARFSGDEAIFQTTYGVTIRNSEIIDATDDAPDSATNWVAHADRESGIYISGTQGILLEGNLIDHNGWADGYDPAGSVDSGQPPSMYSHNVYLQANNLDVTYRDNVSMRAASIGAQIRSGGFVEDNVFLDNNIPVNFLGGDYDGAGPVGHYTLFSDNLTTSAGYRTADKIGALNWGVRDSAYLSTMVDNIVAHLADPNNLAEQASKPSAGAAVNSKYTPYYDDTIIYNWTGGTGSGPADQNVDGLNTGVLDQTTIQLFTAQLLGKETATIADLANYLRAQANGAFDDLVDADMVIRFFQEGFGIAPDIRGEEDTLRFVPNDLGDGVRWDNRLNWSTEDLPGTQDGDSVELGGNWVHYSSLTTTIDDLDYGSGGRLNVTSGRLNVGGETQIGDWGAKLTIDNAGQYWTDGLVDDDRLTVDIDGGRFANTGLFRTPTDFSVADNGQAILATDDSAFDLGAGSKLELVGDRIRVGFDGDEGGTAVLRLDDQSTLSFLADADGDLATIREFKSGAFGDSPDVLSGVNLGSAALKLNLAGFDGTNVDLISVDELIGSFGTVDVTGLASGKGAKIVVDYTTDKVSLQVVDGSGVKVETLGTQQSSDLAASEANALWTALTAGQGTYEENSPVDEDDPFADAA